MPGQILRPTHDAFDRYKVLGTQRPTDPAIIARSAKRPVSPPLAYV
jgi:hypothetical protein